MTGNASFAVVFSPFVPLWALIGLAALCSALLLYSTIRNSRGVILRTAALATGILTLANPAAVQEERIPLKDVAVVVLDTSPSQSVGNRTERAEASLSEVTRLLNAFGDLDVRIIRTGNEEGAVGTRLFTALERTLADVSPDRVAATILITDGQVHDAPAADAALLPARRPVPRPAGPCRGRLPAPC